MRRLYFNSFSLLSHSRTFRTTHLSFYKFITKLSSFQYPNSIVNVCAVLFTLFIRVFFSYVVSLYCRR